MIRTIATDQKIRPLDTRKDLLQVADLIETCFGPHLDQDGYLYLSQIRKAAANTRKVRWTYAAGELVSYPLNGYVFEQDGKVVGNLSLIPLYWKRQWRYLIANVAVHPEFRRQGIAKRLTEKALQHAERRPIDSVWLHVRADNDAAIRLYEQFHFISRDIRDTWINCEPYLTPDAHTTAYSIGSCQGRDWGKMETWLHRVYPPDVAWHLPLDISRYRPSLLNSMRTMLEGKPNQHWCVRDHQRLAGAAILEKGYSHADQVFLAGPAGEEDAFISHILPLIKLHHSPGRSVTVNFPAYTARPAFVRAGFELLNTLIWMEIKIN